MGNGGVRLSVAVLVTCHNRVVMTLRGLRLLLPQLRADDEVFMVDDGSKDGTSAQVRAKFPRVRIIVGDGTLYWAKGMRMAWKKAVEERADWDGYLWLNDDTELRSDAIEKILAENDGARIVVGELENAKGEIVYGVREGRLFTGNCVLVPKTVYEKLGMICGEYAHAWADYDYAMMAREAGIEVKSAGIVGRAEGHPNRPSLSRLDLRGRLRLLNSPKGWNLHDLWLYRRRHWGVWAAILSCLHLVLHVIWGAK